MHHYIGRRFAEVPSWLDEGIASYLEGASQSDGSLHFPVAPVERLSRLVRLRDGQLEWTPFADYLALSSEEFYEDSPRHYAQALAFTHYSPSHGDLLRTFLGETSDAGKEPLQSMLKLKVRAGLAVAMHQLT